MFRGGKGVPKYLFIIKLRCNKCTYFKLSIIRTLIIKEYKYVVPIFYFKFHSNLTDR